MDSFAALIQKAKVDRMKKRKRIGVEATTFVRRGEFRHLEENGYDAEEQETRRKNRKRGIIKKDEHSTSKSGTESSRALVKISTEHLMGGKEEKSSSIELATTEGLRSSSGRHSMPRIKVIRELRKRGKPGTLFGETDTLRRERLYRVIEEKQNRPDNSDLALPASHRGRNIFLDNAYEALSDEERMSNKGDDGVTVEMLSKSAKVVDSEPGHSKRRPRTPEMICYKFFKKMLREWADSLANRPDAEKRSVKGKVAMKTQRQCKDYMRPFFKMCKKKQVSPTILDKVVMLVKHCEDREYVKAHSVYMDLAIGRSAWPIGATSVGIHERAARERIQTNKIAHVMNDEGARKYVTSMKRLMTICQANYPAEGPSKMVLH